MKRVCQNGLRRSHPLAQIEEDRNSLWSFSKIIGTAHPLWKI